MKRKNFIFTAVALPVFLLTLFSQLFLIVPKAHAVQVTNMAATAIDAANIRVTFTYDGVDREVLLTDVDVFDNTYRYQKVGDSQDGCHGELSIANHRSSAYNDAVNAIKTAVGGNFSDVEDGSTSVDSSISFVDGKQAERVALLGTHSVSGIDLDFKATANGNCLEIDTADGGSEDTLTIGGASNLMKYWRQVDPNTIKRIDDRNDDWTYSKDATRAGIYLRTSEDGDTCQDFIYAVGTNVNMYEINGGGNTDYLPSRVANEAEGCQMASLTFNNLSLHITGSNDAGWSIHQRRPYNPWQSKLTSDVPPPPANGGGPSQPPGSGGASAAPEESCEAQGGALAWILCSVISALDGGISYVDNQIESLLEFNSDNFNDSGVKASAARVRNLAYFILIPIMLVMVIGTALGFEFISAYTVKKALPRLVVATIFIALSSQLMFFLVDLTNVVGNGISGLILGGLLQNSSGSLQSILNPGQAAGTTVLFGAVGAGAAIVIGPAIIGILLSYALVAFLVLFLTFAILAVRQVLILVLALMAPLAILAWIFPGNDKLWKAWWGTFSKLLLMYPLIIILITAGKVFATFVHGVQGEPLSTLITVTAYIAPYFFIPATFKWAGGIFGTIAGVANDRSKGIFDRQKAARGKMAGEGWRDFRSGGVGGNGIRKFASRNVGQRVGVGMKGRFGLGSQEKFRQARDQLERQASIDNVMKGPAWNAVDNNDDALHAATYQSAREAQAALALRWGDAARADRAVKAVQTSIGFGRPQAIAAAQQLVSTGTGYESMGEMVSTLARASGGNANTAKALSGFANAETKKVGRFDLAPGYDRLQRAVRDTGGMLEVGEVAPAPQELTGSAWQSASLYQHANGKPRNIEAAIAHHETELAAGRISMEDYAVFHEELKAMQPNAIGESAQLINAAVEARADDVAAYLASAPATPLSAGTARVVRERDGTTYSRAETAKERVAKRARAYERPDPNNIT